MSGRTYTWSKFHNRVQIPNLARLHQRNEFIQFTAIIGITAILFICILEVVIQSH